jgi:hypothetical protein
MTESWDRSKDNWRKMREDQREVRSGKKKYIPKPYSDTGAGKGDKRRPIGITREEYGLRYDLATGRISKDDFDKRMADLDTE